MLTEKTLRGRHVHIGVVRDASVRQRERADHGDVVAPESQLLEHRLEPAEVAFQRHGHERQYVRGERGWRRQDRRRQQQQRQ